MNIREPETREEELLLYCWIQFSYSGHKRNKITRHDAGLATLEELKEYLLEKHLINEDGMWFWYLIE